MCEFPALEEVQLGERVPKQAWSLWDPEIKRRGGRVHIPAPSNSDSESMDGNIDSDSEYDLESLLSAENSESDNLDWENISLPGDLAEMRSEMLTQGVCLFHPLISLTTCMCLQITFQLHQFTLQPPLTIPQA